MISHYKVEYHRSGDCLQAIKDQGWRVYRASYYKGDRTKNPRWKLMDVFKTDDEAHDFVFGLQSGELKPFLGDLFLHTLVEAVRVIGNMVDSVESTAFAIECFSIACKDVPPELSDIYDEGE